MKTIQEHLQLFETRAFEIGDYPRLNAYLWLELVQESLTYDEVLEKMLEIHADKQGC